MAVFETSVGTVEVTGAPTEAEVAAIVAAIEMAWPRPAAVAVARRTESTTWKHADRWWAAGRLPSGWR